MNFAPVVARAQHETSPRPRAVSAGFHATNAGWRPGVVRVDQFEVGPRQGALLSLVLIEGGMPIDHTPPTFTHQKWPVVFP